MKKNLFLFLGFLAFMMISLSPAISQAQFGNNCPSETAGVYSYAKAAGCFPNPSTSSAPASCTVEILRDCIRGCPDIGGNPAQRLFTQCKSTCSSYYGDAACNPNATSIGSCSTKATAAAQACGNLANPSTASEVDTCQVKAEDCKTTCGANSNEQRTCQSYLDKIAQAATACDNKLKELNDRANGNAFTTQETSDCKKICMKAGSAKEEMCSGVEIASTGGEPQAPDAILDEPTDDREAEVVDGQQTYADPIMQQQMLQGMSTGPVPNVNMGNYGTGGGVGFSEGTRGGGYGNVDTSVGNGGFDAPNIASSLPFEPPVYSGFGGDTNPAGAAAPSSAGSMGGGGGGGMGGGMMPASAGGGGRAPRRGGGYGGLSDKSSGQTFYPGGGSKSGGGGGKARTTAASPVNTQKPKYQPKGNSDSLALARLFGQPRGNAMGQGGPTTNNYYGRHCADTVFCNMENFFQQVDRYPNSEIKDVGK